MSKPRSTLLGRSSRRASPSSPDARDREQQRTTNAIERLNGEFRRRVKTQCSLCSEDAAVVVLFSLVATGKIRLRKLDGYETIPTVISSKLNRAA
jgi:transposase-like protein